MRLAGKFNKTKKQQEHLIEKQGDKSEKAGLKSTNFPKKHSQIAFSGRLKQQQCHKI